MTLEISMREALWFLPFVTPIAAWVAWSDAATMKIPNKAVGALMAVFVVVGLLVLPFDEWAWRLVQFAVVLAITFVMSVLRLMGAGDAKFAAAMAPFIAPGDAASFFFLLVPVIVVAFIAHRLARRSARVRARFPDWVSWQRRDFPMGVALAPALVLYLALGAALGTG